MIVCCLCYFSHALHIAGTLSQSEASDEVLRIFSCASLSAPDQAFTCSGVVDRTDRLSFWVLTTATAVRNSLPRPIRIGLMTSNLDSAPDTQILIPPGGVHHVVCSSILPLFLRVFLEHRWSSEPSDSSSWSTPLLISPIADPKPKGLQLNWTEEDNTPNAIALELDTKWRGSSRMVCMLMHADSVLSEACCCLC